MNCLKKWFHQDWLCRERLGVEKKKILFYYCERVYEGSAEEDSKEWKTQKKQGLTSFTVLKAHCHIQTFQDAFHLLSLFCVFFPPTLNPPSTLWLRPKAMSLSAPPVHHIAILNTISDQCRHRRLFALSHSSISGFASGSAERPHQENLIITVIVFTWALWLWLPRTWPHLNHYLFPHTISPKCHNQGESICFGLFYYLLSTFFHIFSPLNPLSDHSSWWGKAGE